MSFVDKAKAWATQARGKAEELAEKAGPSAVKGVQAAKTRLDQATGGKYHDKIENVSSKVESVLTRQQQPKETTEKPQGTEKPPEGREGGEGSGPGEPKKP